MFNVLLTLLLPPLLFTLPAAGQAEDYTYTTNNGTITITGYTGPGGAVAIPDTITGLPVTSLGIFTFSYCTNVASVVIPGSVTNLGEAPFSFCSSLTAITVDTNNPVYSSVDGVLFNKSQTALIRYPAGKAASQYTIPNSVTTIEGSQGWSGEGGAFYSCTNLTDITIGNSVNSIGYDAFFFCTSLTSITIPDSVTNIGSSAFWGCSSLTGVTIPDNVINIGSSAFWGCSSLTSVTIPSSVTSIGNNAFAGCTSLSVIMVDTNNPVYCSVDGVLFNKSQTVLIQCPGGKAGSYIVPNSVTSVGNGAFDSCASLTSVTIGKSVASIGSWAFYSCTNLTDITIPNSVTSIGVAAFIFCTSLTSITIPDSVTNIGGEAFLYCDSLTAIMVDTNNLAYSSVDGVLFNQNQTTLIQYPAGKAENQYTIPNTVTKIGGSAFHFCTSLTSVTIPDSVTSIGVSEGLGRGAFFFCTSLSSVYFKGNAPSVSSDVFEEANNATVYHLPGTTGWGTAYGGRPTSLWLPRVQTSDDSFGVRTNQFGFNITWASGRVTVVEASSNLANPIWSPVSTNTLTSGSSYFSDPQWTNYSARFYRLRSP